MGRKTQRHAWADEPGRLLGHDGPHDIWAKLNWEANQLRSLRAAGPPLDIDGMAYLTQSASISAVAAVEWLRNAITRATRDQPGDGKAINAAITENLPDLPLARAIANTLKHGEYRDEGWGDAQIRVDVFFTAAQRTRLSALEGTDGFDEAYADEAAHADTGIGFVRGGTTHHLDAVEFAMGLADGVLRLIDACADDAGGFQDPE